MNINSKINYFLKNAPSDSVLKLNEMLNEVNIFVKDVRNSTYSKSEDLPIKLHFQVTIERFEKETLKNVKPIKSNKNKLDAIAKNVKRDIIFDGKKVKKIYCSLKYRRSNSQIFRSVATVMTETV